MADLIEYLPDYYFTSRIMQAIMNAQGTEIDKLYAALDSVLNQFFVETADDWGLQKWAHFVQADYKIVNTWRDLSDRTWDVLNGFVWTDLESTSVQENMNREYILAKLRGYGAATQDLFKQVALSFTNGNIEIIENPSQYEFTIKFTDVKGIPPNMEQFINAIEEIKPAHLVYDIQYTYNVWEFLTETKKDWNDLNPYTWNQIMVI
jgi:hypothetical protein